MPMYLEDIFGAFVNRLLSSVETPPCMHSLSIATLTLHAPPPPIPTNQWLLHHHLMITPRYPSFLVT